VLEETNGVFAAYITHKNAEGVVTWRAKLCQVQQQDDKKSIPYPTLSLNSVAWQLQGLFLREMSKITSPSSFL